MEYVVDLNATPAQVSAALTECKREAGARRAIYPKWIDRGSITASLASERLTLIDTTISILEQIAATMHQPHQELLDFAGDHPRQ